MGQFNDLDGEGDFVVLFYIKNTLFTFSSVASSGW